MSIKRVQSVLRCDSYRKSWSADHSAKRRSVRLKEQTRLLMQVLDAFLVYALATAGIQASRPGHGCSLGEPAQPRQLTTPTTAV